MPLLGSVTSQVFTSIAKVARSVSLRRLDNPNAYGTVTIDQFGYFVAISGNYAIVGVPGEDAIPPLPSDGLDSGRAYIFNVLNGELIRTLTNPSIIGGGSDDAFGISVAISDNYAIVGAYGEKDVNGNALSGAAYIYNVTTGALIYTLTNPNAVPTSLNDRFGFSVSISGNYAIVGAYSEDETSISDSGKAYIYNVTTGALVHTLDNPNAYGTPVGDNFGWSVSISGNYAIVGAFNEDGTSSGAGKAYIFNVTTGALLHTLDNPNTFVSTNDRFGYSVAVSGNYAIVGAYQTDDAGGLSSGKAYIYNVTTGALLHTLNNPNAYGTSASDNFGLRVAISGNYAIVSARLEDDANGSGAGKAYIFNVTTGALLHTLNNPNAYGTGVDDNFGWAVAISGNYAIVGAFGEDEFPGGNSSGKAYIYNIPGNT